MLREQRHRIDVAREHIVERRAGCRHAVLRGSGSAFFFVEIGKEHALHLRVRVEKRDEMLRKLPRADDADFDAHGRRLSPGSPLGFNANPAD